jgi:ABC-type uncharacterized transport system substrate-binding protein
MPIFARRRLFVADLVRRNVDIIVAYVTQASLAAKAVTSAIPIVMVAVSDPVESGLVRTLARPGGNVSGTSSVAAGVPAVDEFRAAHQRANGACARRRHSANARRAGGSDHRVSKAPDARPA